MQARRVPEPEIESRRSGRIDCGKRTFQRIDIDFEEIPPVGDFGIIRFRQPDTLSRGILTRSVHQEHHALLGVRGHRAIDAAVHGPLH